MTLHCCRVTPTMWCVDYPRVRIDGLPWSKFSKFGILHSQIEVMVLNIGLLPLCNLSYETVDKSFISVYSVPPMVMD